METPVSYFVNCTFAWFIVLLAVAGYFLMLRRMMEKWVFWIVLAAGWAFFAISYTLLIAGITVNMWYITGIWLSSYLLVMASLVLLFIKLTKLKKQSQTLTAIKTKD